MAEQVYRHEMSIGEREVTRRLAKIVGNKIARVFGDLVLSEQPDHPDNQARTHRPECDAPRHLQKRIQPL